MDDRIVREENKEEIHLGRTLLEITKDFYAASPRELPVSKGEIVKYLGREKGWIRAKTSDGFVGYIPIRCCRGYDAKKIRQRRKQMYREYQYDGEETMQGLRGHVEPNKEIKEKKSHQLKHFINTAVCEAIDKMSFNQQKNTDVESHKYMSYKYPNENPKNKRHASGVCGRSCRICYSECGLKKFENIERPPEKYETGYDEKVERKKPENHSVRPVQAIFGHNNSPIHKYQQENNITHVNDCNREDRSDSGIYVGQQDECDCSHCNSETNALPRVPMSDVLSSSNQYVPMAPLERYFSTDYFKGHEDFKQATVEPKQITKETPSCDCDKLCTNRATLLVLRNFVQDEDQDLTVWKGDIVTLISDSEQDWLWVQDKDGKEGFIPRAYVTDETCTECRNLLLETLQRKQAAPVKEGKTDTKIRSPSPKPVNNSQFNAGKGVRFYVLSDHTGTNGNSVTVRVGDVVVANMQDQLIDGWLWIYSPDQKVSGYLPEDILLEADPVEVTDV